MSTASYKKKSWKTSSRQEERLAKRRARYRRMVGRAGKVSAPARLGEDPLVRSAARDAKKAWLIPILLLGAVLAHGAFTVGVGAVAKAFALGEAAEEEKIVVEINEIPPPPPEVIPDVIPEPEPDPEVIAEPEPEPEAKPKPEPKAKPEPEPEPEPESPPPPPRRVIGLDFGSTVSGGTGPAFGTGNALDGTTATTAVDPTKVKSNPGESTEPVKVPTKPGPNRVATIVPREGVKLVKPKRKERVKPVYPPLLKAQGIEANVVVEVQITAQGKVASVAIISPAKEAEFNEAAKAAAAQEIFEPATRNGKAIAFSLTFTYRYRISD